MWISSAPSLGHDLGGALGDSSWADVKFVAGGRPIFAHRCILVARSAYFAAMFRSGMQEGASDQPGAVVDVVVPDSHVGLFRLLHFIYTGTLAPAEHAVLMDDLVAADRYNLIEMKRLCESMITLSPANCCETYQIARAIDAPRLSADALGYLVSHLADVRHTPAFAELRASTPTLAGSILERAMASNASLSHGSSGVQQRVEKAATRAGVHDFPIWASVTIVVCCFAYSKVASTVVLGPLVPVINSVVVLAVVVMMCFGLR